MFEYNFCSENVLIPVVVISSFTTMYSLKNKNPQEQITYYVVRSVFIERSNVKQTNKSIPLVAGIHIIRDIVLATYSRAIFFSAGCCLI